jgi:hypothetical protein
LEKLSLFLCTGAAQGIKNSLDKLSVSFSETAFFK